MTTESSESQERFDFPREEQRILDYWDSIDAFQTSMRLSKEEARPFFTFYDGPPFATGLPHYGHILAATIKDIVLRYAYAKGYHVERRFGWDCHGLPVEHEIDKRLNITCRADVMKMGIDKYNEECRSIVTRYTNEWEAIVKRSGRWIDFKNDFKTMYPSFMESVWWVFKELYNKDYVYKGYKVMPYSTACTSPLSNFETNLNYKDITDPAVVVSFSLRDEPETGLLIWTTTPWTLMSNLAITVHPDFFYLKIKDIETARQFILSENRLPVLYKDPAAGTHYEVLGRIKGSDLVGRKYVPLFDYFKEREAQGGFAVVSDNYVTDDAGTGLVHCAPGFGEDDQRIALSWKIVDPDEPLPCPVDEVGRFTSQVGPFAGLYFKDADKEIIRMLKGSGHLIRQSQLTHSYPFCWRSDTPLMYRAIPSWFVRVTPAIDRLLANNSKTYWVPEHVKEKKFANWLASAPDWAISRNRYWGTPIPVWVSEDGVEIEVIGSIAELETKSGVQGVTDLHRHFVDRITIPSKRPGQPPLKRIDEVFDCWFESGSVPYAAQHYPFENKGTFDQHFPADFIGEGIDQTRGWFYTLMVLSTLLLDRPPFKNLIVNGLILAADGKKMSKRLKNYPEPVLVMESYGADALRLYLINSPVVAGESLKFKEEGVKGILRDVFLPWVNAVKFFIEQVDLFKVQTGKSYTVDYSLSEESAEPRPNNVMDHWILASLQSLIGNVRAEMDSYKLYAVLPKLLKFIDDLTNWYVRLNRPRLKGHFGEVDRHDALGTLYYVLFDLARVLASFVPFLAENIYQKLKRYLKAPLRVKDDRSVHFLMFPTVKKAYLDVSIERAVARMQDVIDLVRNLREAQSINLKVPLKSLTVLVSTDTEKRDLELLQTYLLDELNLKKVIVTTDEKALGVSYKVVPNFAALGTRLRHDFGKVQAALKNVPEAQLKVFLEGACSSLNVLGYELTHDDLTVTRQLLAPPPGHMAKSSKSVIVLLDMTIYPELEMEGMARELVNRVQKLRKGYGLKASHQVKMYYSELVGPKVKELLTSQADMITKSLRQSLEILPDDASVPKSEDSVIGKETVLLADGSLTLTLAKLSLN